VTWCFDNVEDVREGDGPKRPGYVDPKDPLPDTVAPPKPSPTVLPSPPPVGDKVK
jgi:hypothetical protein